MKRYSRTLRKACQQWQLFLFLLIPLVYLIIYCYYPMLGLQIAFRKFKIRDGIWGSAWVGMANFRKFFGSYMFERVIRNTMGLSLYNILAGFPLPIMFALMLNTMRNKREKKIVQTITYIPHFISSVVMVGMVIQIFSPISGIYTMFVKWLTGTIPSNLLANPSAFPHIYVWSGIWQQFGWDSIIYVAALAGISEELHEAAEVDGASRAQRLWHIDLPGLLPTIIIMLILRCGSVMTIGFEKVYLLQNDMNLRASEVISTYEYKISMSTDVPNYSLSTAIGMFNSVINMILISVVNVIARRATSISLW